MGGYRVRMPGARLAPFVDQLWSWDDGRMPALADRAMPSGAFAIVIDLGGAPWDVAREVGGQAMRISGGMMVGAYSGSYVVSTQEGTAVMGVLFHPAGARPFLDGAPASALADDFVDLESLWGRSGKMLRERLLEARTADARFDLLEAFLEARLAPRPLHGDVALALDAIEGGKLRSLAALTDDLGISPKRLIALFREQVGMLPKAYWRVRRLQSAMRRLTEPHLGLAALALELGYADQAHFNREFKAFTHLTPAAYASTHGARPMHVPL